MADGEVWLTGAQRARLAPLLPCDTRGVARVDDRRVISGIVHVLRSGGRWADAPACCGPRKTLCDRLVRWAAKGAWDEVFPRLAAEGGPPAAPMIEATPVKAHRCAAGGKGGRRRRPSAAPEGAAPPSSPSPPTSAGAHGG